MKNRIPSNSFESILRQIASKDIDGKGHVVPHPDSIKYTLWVAFGQVTGLKIADDLKWPEFRWKSKKRWVGATPAVFVTEASEYFAQAAQEISLFNWTPCEFQLVCHNIKDNGSNQRSELVLLGCRLR